MPKWLIPTVTSALLGGILAFSAWAASGISASNAQDEAQKVVNSNQTNTNNALQQQLTNQQAQIAVFQKMLGDIHGDIKAIKARLEERARNEN